MQKMRSLPGISDQVAEEALRLLRRKLFRDVTYGGMVAAMVGPAEESALAIEILDSALSASWAAAGLRTLRVLAALHLGPLLCRALRLSQWLRRIAEFPKRSVLPPQPRVSSTGAAQ